MAKKKEESSSAGKENKQKRLIKKKRAGEVLTEQQVREIKKGRKKLRKDMKKMGIRSRKEFELTASSMGLYFDKDRFGGLLMWLLHGRALYALLGAAAALLAVFFLFSKVTQMRGHFTINLTDDMFLNGFVLSDDKEFSHPTSMLYSQEVENVPCTSISNIPADITEQDGCHNGADYFAYTFYLKYQGEEVEKECNYAYEVAINSETQDLSKAAWLMLFVDDEMSFYAKQSADGKEEALPAYAVTGKGYRESNLPHLNNTLDKDTQYQVVGSNGTSTYYRIIPKNFEDEVIMASGKHENVKIGDVHKYTVVLWLEGDDPDCTDELIGGNLGIEMNFRYYNDVDSANDQETTGNPLKRIWEKIKDSLPFL